MTTVMSQQQPNSRVHNGTPSLLPFRHPHSVVRSRLERRKFSLLVRLPDDSLTRIKQIKDGTSIKQVKNTLELTAGLPSPAYQLHDISGHLMANGTILRLDENVADNSIIQLSLLPPYDKVYQFLMEEDNSHLQSFESSEVETIFNILYMASYFGNTEYSTSLLSTTDVAASMTTANGNTPLHAATAKDHVSTSLLLCEYGADIHQPNHRGSTPLDVALEFGSFTCERHLRLSQWARRKGAIKKTKTETTPLYLPKDGAATHTSPINNVKLMSKVTTIEDSQGEGTTLNTHEIQETVTPYSNNEDTGINSNDKDKRLSNDEETKNSGRLGLPKDGAATHTSPKNSGRLGLTRAKSANVNHKMPPSATEKRRERLSRAQSAPLLNSAERNKRMCKTEVEHNKAAKQGVQRCSQSQQGQGQRSQSFAMTRPQYLQYIKSSTGVVEEDYFADIFPDQTDGTTPKSYRSFDDQMKRNERIFKKMFKESGIAHQNSDTDSDEENLRQYANKKAVRRWAKKKGIQKQEEKLKRCITPSYPTGKEKEQCLGGLLLIGDTSSGNTKPTDPGTYIGAYHSYKKESRAKSAASTVRQQTEDSVVQQQTSVSGIDPITYKEWVERKPEATKISEDKSKPVVTKRELTKKIDYQTWLNQANSRISKQLQQRKKEEKQKKDFDVWIQELKDEVGTYEYWKRRKEEQIRKERRIQQRKQEELDRKANEKARKRELAKEIYKHWVINKELSHIKQEEKELLRERQQLNRVKQAANTQYSSTNTATPIQQH